jgi:hypothetical protein
MSLETLREESKATVRRPIAKVVVTWTDPLIDTSINTEVSEENRVSHPVQLADLVTTVPRKWFHTNDTSVVLDGSHYPAPSTLKEARANQMGWWGSQSSDGSGNFSTPPQLSVTFARRLVESANVTGDSAMNEYPVDYTIKVYNTSGGGFALAETISIAGNTQISRNHTFTQSHPNATKLELTISKWSAADKVAKIAEFYSAVVEEFGADDIMLLNILQEFESAEGTLPVGNISCNELDLSLQNITDRFFSENTNSDIYNLIRRNRKIEPYLGFRYKNGTEEYIPMGLYWSGDWATTDNSTFAQTSARDRFELMRKKKFPYDEVFTEILSDVSIKFLMTAVLESLFTYMYDFYYDISDMDDNYTVPHFDPEFFKKKTYFEVVKELAVAGLLYVYMDTPTDEEITENGVLCKDMFRAKRLETVFPEAVVPANAIQITKDDFIDKSQLADTESMANTIDVVYKQFSLVDGEWDSEDVTYTVEDAASISEYGVMDYEYQTSDLIQLETHAEDVAYSLLESFKIPKRDIEINAFGDITLELANQISVPEYQKTNVDRRGIFAVTKRNPQYDGSLRMVVSGRKLTDDNSDAVYEGRGLMAQPTTEGLSGVMSSPSTEDASGYMVEPYTVGREADV